MEEVLDTQRPDGGYNPYGGNDQGQTPYVPPAPPPEQTPAPPPEQPPATTPEQTNTPGQQTLKPGHEWWDSPYGRIQRPIKLTGIVGAVDEGLKNPFTHDDLPEIRDQQIIQPSGQPVDVPGANPVFFVTCGRAGRAVCYWPCKIGLRWSARWTRTVLLCYWSFQARLPRSARWNQDSPSLRLVMLWGTQAGQQGQYGHAGRSRV